jgi:hypothetical protein
MSDSVMTDRELLPPDETFWKRYSPRHECPIAASASTLLHLVALGGVVLAGLAMSWRWYGERSQPVKMSVVFVDGGPGDGRSVGGGGGSPTPAGTENIAQPQTPQASVPEPKTSAPLILPKSPTDVDNTELGVTQPMPTTNDKDFRAKLEAKMKADLARANSAIAAKGNGTPEPGRGGTGTGGGLGTGKGTGTGSKEGPGTGTGGTGMPATTKAAQAQILANRWRFESGGSPRDRIAKLAAFGMTLGFTDFTGNLYILEDLKNRPSRSRLESFDRYKETVIWGLRKNNPDVPGLCRELMLPATASDIVLLLPADREQQMADEEMRYSKEKGYDFSKVEATLFDFELVRGSYEPVVKGQAPFDRNVPNGKTRTR